MRGEKRGGERGERKRVEKKGGEKLEEGKKGREKR